MNFRLSSSSPLFVLCIGLFLLCLGFDRAAAQDAKLTQAMNITPKQTVEIEKPGIAELKECKFSQTTNPSGFVVHHSSGRILRQYLDTNKDGRLDQWSYFLNGQEVYRDVDQNYDGKTDQYRWLGEAGSRWGLDNNQDGVIDSWKVISAEEVAYECFQAIKNQDQDRFNRLLITPQEFSGLQLGPKIAKDIQGRWQEARSGFLGMVRGQKSVTSKSKWVYAGNGWPSMMPAGPNGKKDLVVYNHGAGFYEDADGANTAQLALGSLVKIGDVWRMIELPEVYDGKALNNGGAFFPLPEFGAPGLPNPGDKRLAGLHDRLSKIEQALLKASGVEAEKLEKEKAELFKDFITATAEPKNKKLWVETLADSVSSAYQSERFDGGVEYLEDFVLKNPKLEGIDYAAWRAIFAEYGRATMEGDRRERDRAASRLVDQLKGFVTRYPRSQFAPDALVQLGVSLEVSDPDEPGKALEWYNLCRKNYPNTKYGKRSVGAATRLGSFGKTFPFKGKTVDGRTFDIRSAAGKIVVLHFWQTSDPQGIEELAKISSKFKEDVLIVSCNIESVVDENGLNAGKSTAAFKDFLSKNKSKMTWIQLHAPGGVENSDLAHQLGVATEPMLVLIDKKGRLVETNIPFGTLEREVESERRRKD